MKKLLTTIAAVLVGFVATPNTAEAGVHISIGTGYTYVSGRASCGCPIYTKRVVRGYDGYRRPIYSYYRQPFNCGCRTAYRAPVVRHGYSSRYVSPRYSTSRSTRSSHHSSSNRRYVTPSRSRSASR
ncbi:MAG: hypothetical protein ACSHYB_12895 [Roseibacillus sp.]